ncbi:unnamed protein product, partial [Ectocarpus sp. 12 AP-2014]
GKSGGRQVAGKGGGSGHLRGAAAAVELCGEAHSVLGRRDEDERTWDHASAELAMAYLCLGVERRQELLGALLRADEANEGTADTERRPVAWTFFCPHRRANQGRGGAAGASPPDLHGYEERPAGGCVPLPGRAVLR